MKKVRWILPAVCVGFAALVAFPAAQADGDDDELVGTWRFTVDGSPIAFPEFFDLIVFHEDHTLTERVSFGTESMGSGVWEEIDDDYDDDDDSENFAVMWESFNDDPLDGVFDFRTRVRMTAQLVDDTLTGTATVEIRTVDNTTTIVTFPPLPFVAVRMTVIPQ